MPKKIEHDPQRIAKLKQQSVFTTPYRIEDIPHTTRFTENMGAEGSLQEMSESLTSIMHERLLQGKKIMIQDGSYAINYALTPIIGDGGDHVQAVTIVAKEMFKEKERFFLQNPQISAEFSQDKEWKNVSIHIRSAETELSIPSDGAMRPNSFIIISEELLTRGGKVIGVEHEILAARADKRGSLRMGNGYEGQGEWGIRGRNK
jgi:hypothetical protein